jgi:hypothetical protein
MKNIETYPQQPTHLNILLLGSNRRLIFSTLDSQLQQYLIADTEVGDIVSHIATIPLEHLLIEPYVRHEVILEATMQAIEISSQPHRRKA